MDRNIVIVAGIIAALTVGAGLISSSVSAHMFDDGYMLNSQDPVFDSHYQEMLDLHGQYYNGEISYDEFGQKMLEESEEFHGEGFGCHGGFNMMGPSMMGW